MIKERVTAEQYKAIFDRECCSEYPQIAKFEWHVGYALDTDKLRDAARVLACPYKVNPANWQHGRIIYATLRSTLENSKGFVTCLDIGTAKGFSALCMQWALDDAPNIEGKVVSVDVIDPKARVQRNTVAEVDGLKTLYEILEPWPEARKINFVKSTGESWLLRNHDHLNFVFVDGKHKYEAVSAESCLIAQHQLSGDYILFDDMQIDGIAKAASELRGYTELAQIHVNTHRSYALMCKEAKYSNGHS